MKRSSLANFIRSAGNNRELLNESRAELESYAECVKKKGATCHITMVGDPPEWCIEIRDIHCLIEVFLKSEIQMETLDYITNAILLDEKSQKTDEAEKFLEDVAAVLSDLPAEQIRRALINELKKDMPQGD